MKKLISKGIFLKYSKLKILVLKYGKRHILRLFSGIAPKKSQFAAYGQFVLVFIRYCGGNLNPEEGKEKGQSVYSR